MEIIIIIFLCNKCAIVLLCTSLSVFRFSFSKRLFDPIPEDPSYNTLPEERPGGFAWGEGMRAGGNADRDGAEDQPRDQ